MSSNEVNWTKCFEWVWAASDWVMWDFIYDFDTQTFIEQEKKAPVRSF